MSAQSQRVQPGVVVRAPRRAAHAAPAQNYVVSQALFISALARELWRSERFEQPFGLVRISLSGEMQTKQRWSQVLDALAATRRDTDVIGWFQEGASIGLIRSYIDLAPNPTASALESAVRCALESCFASGTASPFRVQAEIHSPHAEFTHQGPADSPISQAVTRSSRRPGDITYATVKRLIDIAGGAALLAACSPAFIVVAGLVKFTSRGPVFFRQERVGRHGRPFTMLKFRTMRVDAAHDIHQQYVTQYIQGRPVAEAAPAGEAAVFKLVADPRITPIGHFLRRSSLDEVPQFWNVLKGEMSLVGPRPPLPYEVRCYRPWHRRRVLEAKPGITGLWQVTGRSRTTFDEMVRLDIRYARTRSIWVDLKILLATPRAVITGSGAR